MQNEKKLTKLAINIVFLSVNLYQTNRINVAIGAAAMIGQKQLCCRARGHSTTICNLIGIGILNLGHKYFGI